MGQGNGRRDTDDREKPHGHKFAHNVIQSSNLNKNVSFYSELETVIDLSMYTKTVHQNNHELTNSKI